MRLIYKFTLETVLPQKDPFVPLMSGMSWVSTRAINDGF